MKRIAKKTAKSSILSAKKLIMKNTYSRSAAKKVKNILLGGSEANESYDYLKYYPSIEHYHNQLNAAKTFKYQPLISIVMPTYNTAPTFLKACLKSVIIQSYPNWELCIADDKSTNKEVVEIIKEFQKKDKRIKLIERKVNGHISEASNSAISITQGKYIALLDHDDILWPNALYSIVETVNSKPEADLIYSDEDKINGDGSLHSYPFLKPDWSPEFLESCNYITHFACIKSTVMSEVGGFRKGYEGAQDWDLFLRVADKTQKIVHIPKILYSWRIHASSTAQDTDSKPYVYDAQRKLLTDHISRQHRKGVVKSGQIPQHSFVSYTTNEPYDVGVIIIAESVNNLDYHIKEIKKSKHSPHIYIVHREDITEPVKKIVKDEKLNAKFIESNSLSLSHIVKDTNRVVSKHRNIKNWVFIGGGVKLKSAYSIDLFVSDLSRDGVAVVGGKICSTTDKKMIASAGIGIGIHNIAGNILAGTDVNDNHYMRALYGKSRRNVSAVSDSLFAFKSEAYNDTGGFGSEMGEFWLIDFCLEAKNNKYRVIYNPYVVAESNRQHNYKALSTTSQGVKFKEKWKKYIDNDPYINPNFLKTNERLEIK